MVAEKKEEKRQAIAIASIVLKTDKELPLYFTNSINSNIEFNCSKEWTVYWQKWIIKSKSSTIIIQIINAPQNSEK